VRVLCFYWVITVIQGATESVKFLSAPIFRYVEIHSVPVTFLRTHLTHSVETSSWSTIQCIFTEGRTVAQRVAVLYATTGTSNFTRVINTTLVDIFHL
jgi:hypothetical protein